MYCEKLKTYMGHGDELETEVRRTMVKTKCKHEKDRDCCMQVDWVY